MDSNTADMDYVVLFQRVARLHCLIREDGPRRHLLLRRGWLELAMGDYPAAQESAADALAAGGDPTEPHFLHAEAVMGHALASAGAGLWSPGHPVIGRNVPDALHEARLAFAALTDDPQAQRRVASIDGILGRMARGTPMAQAVVA